MEGFQAEDRLDVLEPFAEGEGEVAGLLYCPVAGGVGGDATQMHPAGAMLDEYQDVQSLQQRGAHVEEVDGEDPGGLGVQKLPPGRTRAARPGSMPAVRRISQTVDCTTVTPSFVISQ
jgi:predicted methyltransferase MtxX (methanogen marker protein 4)